MRTVEAQNLTGNVSKRDMMRCAIGLYNGIVRPSHFYDIVRNPTYVIEKQFPFVISYTWLDLHTLELSPTLQLAPSSSSPQVPIIQVSDKTSACGPSTHSPSPDIGDRLDAACAANPVLAPPSSPRSSGLTHERTHPAQATPAPSPPTALPLSNRSRNTGVKSAKKTKQEERMASTEMQYIRDAFDSFSNAFLEANLRSIGAAEVQSQQDYEIRKRADEIEAAKVLFNDGEEMSRK